jgi:CubicO group peptidase (beta-lactamase class C family)
MNAWATGSTDEFMGLAESVSGEDLDAFFQTWLFAPEKPPASAVLPTLASARVSTAGSVPGATTRWTEGWLRFIDARTRGGA